MNASYWLRRPHLVWARTKYWLWERLNPDKPWLCVGSIHYCERHLTASMTGLEFGSGRSTAWFAARLGRLTSVEHDADWYARVRARLDRFQIVNVDLRLIPLGHPESEPERADYEPTPAYVAVLDEFRDASLDLIVVDGHYRSTCVKRCVPKLKPGGLLLIDDANMWHGVGGPPVPPGWHLVDESSNRIKQTRIWKKPSSDS